MGSLTLDELLDATGISEIAGKDLEKKASGKAPPSFAKLADRCRQAASAPPSQPGHELVEKTAEVEIIRRTIAEIESIAGDEPVEKTAAAQADQALFVRTALEEGHPPEAIAEFLEKQGRWRPLARIGDRITEGIGKMQFRHGARMGEKAKGFREAGGRKLETLIAQAEKGSHEEKVRLFNEVYKTMGKEGVQTMMQKIGPKGFEHLPLYKRLFPKGAASVQPPYFSAALGKSTVSATKADLKKLQPYAIGAAGLGVGAALSRGGKSSDSRSGGGPVIINR